MAVGGRPHHQPTDSFMSGPKLELQLGAAIKSCGYGVPPSRGTDGPGGGRKIGVVTSRAILRNMRPMKSQRPKKNCRSSLRLRRSRSMRSDWAATEGELRRAGGRRCLKRPASRRDEMPGASRRSIPDDAHFRSRIVMGTPRFSGAASTSIFSLSAAGCDRPKLRPALYARLQADGQSLERGRWVSTIRYPDSHQAFPENGCHDAGQNPADALAAAI